MSEIEASPEPKTDTHALNRFVTRVWEHPLLTDLTRRKRTEALSAANQIIGDEKDMFLVPVGSAVWVSGQDSDVDFILLHGPNASREKIEQIGSRLSENERAHPDPTRPVLDFAGIHEFEDTLDFNNDKDYLALLFLTPDEYISGDQEFLRQLRLRALNQINYTDSARNSSYFGVWLQNEIDIQLRNIKNWPVKHFSDPNSQHYPRYEEARHDRAAKSRVQPRRWMQKFHRAMTNFSPPSFQEIQASINASGGQIHIEDRYRAQGLETQASS